MLTLIGANQNHRDAPLLGAEVILDNVSVRFKTQSVLNGISLGIKPGNVVAVVGRSGCGKSTLLRLIAGLIKPDDVRNRPKQILIDGMVPQQFCREFRIGMAFQTPSLLPWRSVRENVRLPLEISNKNLSEGSPLHIRRESEAALMVSKLPEIYWDHLPGELSGGMGHRVALARAIVGKPKLLLLDEPFSGLDEFSREELNQSLRSRIEALGSPTVIMVTHSLEEAAFLADYILLLRLEHSGCDLFPVCIPKIKRSFASTEFLEHVSHLKLQLYKSLDLESLDPPREQNHA